MGILGDIQTLCPGRMIELFEVDASGIGGDVMRFHGHRQTAPIIWQGLSYTAWPVQGTGFERTGDASQPSPSLQVGDINGTISALCIVLDDLAGATVTRHRTLVRYLDAENFAAGNADADPTAEMPLEIWQIEQKGAEDPGTSITFKLSTPLDFGGQQIPGRQIVGACQWKYRGPDCGYDGIVYFNLKDEPVDDPALDRCGLRLSSCSARFGENNPLPWGGFLSDVLDS